MDIIKGTKRTRTDHIIKGTKRTRTDIIKENKQTLKLTSKKPMNHKFINIEGKKTRILTKKPTNHKLSKELSEPMKRNKVNQVRYYQRDQANQDEYYQRNQANPYIIKEAK